jgi:hypothetical protein
MAEKKEEVVRIPFEMYGGKVVGYFIEKSHQYWLTHVNGEKLARAKRPASVSSISGMLDKSAQLISWATRVFKEKVVELMGESENFSNEEVVNMLEIGRNAHTEKKEEAAGIGTYVHMFAEQYVKDTNAKLAWDRMEQELGKVPTEMYTRVRDGVVGLQKWIEETGVKLTDNEKIVYSMEHGYIGKHDTVAGYNGLRYLGDFKTSKGVYVDHRIQSALYMVAREEENPKDLFDGTMIISIAKEDYFDKDGNLTKAAGTIELHIDDRETALKLAKIGYMLNGVKNLISEV